MSKIYISSSVSEGAVLQGTRKVYAKTPVQMELKLQKGDEANFSIMSARLYGEVYYISGHS